jgi:hypothetical protein
MEKSQRRGDRENGETAVTANTVRLNPSLSFPFPFLCGSVTLWLFQIERHDPAPIPQIQFCSYERGRGPGHGFEKRSFRQRP